ncbi:MAG: ABC transporter ATP-binding protein [Saprospiraceae bacterium]
MTITPLLSVRELSKKFSKDIKYNMYYGILDLTRRPNRITAQPPELRKREFWAVRDVSFDINPNEIVGVVGTNGSGKTTLMRLIANIYPMDSGRILGRPDLRVTAIFALNSGMQPLFTGRENIYIKASMYGMSRAEIDAKMDFVTDFSELGDKLDRPFGNYSSGMRSRLSYSIALATDPDLFIIDEALAVGDSAFKAKCLDNLKEFAARPDKAVIFVSNQIRKVLKVATRVLIMDTGRIIHESTDIAEALEFYALNSYKGKDEEQRRRELRKIQDYELGN